MRLVHTARRHVAVRTGLRTQSIIDRTGRITVHTTIDSPSAGTGAPVIIDSRIHLSSSGLSTQSARPWIFVGCGNVREG